MSHQIHPVSVAPPRAAPRPAPGRSDVSRRSLLSLSGVALSTAPWGVRPSWALLPDDDDAELVERAKAGRKKRIQEELAAERKFVRDEGLRATDAQKLEKKVQTAVYNLAVSGSKLEEGALAEVSDLMRANWVRDFDAAAAEISVGVTGAKDNAQEILTGITSLQSVAAQGDVAASKAAFVSVVSSFQKWTSLVGLDRSIKGL